MNKHVAFLLMVALVIPTVIDSSAVQMHAFAQPKPVIVQPKDQQQPAVRQRAKSSARASFLKKATAVIVSMGVGGVTGACLGLEHGKEIAALYAVIGGALTGVGLYGVTNKTINSIVNKIMSEAYYEPGWSALSWEDWRLLVQMVEIGLQLIAEHERTKPALKPVAPKPHNTPHEEWGTASGYTPAPTPVPTAGSTQAPHDDEVPGKKKKPVSGGATSSSETAMPAPSAPPAESYYTPAPSAPPVYVPSHDPEPVAEYHKPSAASYAEATAPGSSAPSYVPSHSGGVDEDPC